MVSNMNVGSVPDIHAIKAPSLSLSSHTIHAGCSILEFVELWQNRKEKPGGW